MILMKSHQIYVTCNILFTLQFDSMRQQNYPHSQGDILGPEVQQMWTYLREWNCVAFQSPAIQETTLLLSTLCWSPSAELNFRECFISTMLVCNFVRFGYLFIDCQSWHKFIEHSSFDIIQCLRLKDGCMVQQGVKTPIVVTVCFKLWDFVHPSALYSSHAP